MSFKLTKDDLKKSAKCPPGMHLGELIEVEEPYYSDKKVKVQKCIFETTTGYSVNVWFNDAVTANLFEFVQSADKITLGSDMDDIDIELKNYLHKPVAFSVSHGKDKNNKLQANIDNFFNSDKVPF